MEDGLVAADGSVLLEAAGAGLGDGLGDEPAPPHAATRRLAVRAARNRWRPEARMMRIAVPPWSGRPVRGGATEPSRQPLRLGGDQLVGHAPGLIERKPGLDLGIGENRVVDAIAVRVERSCLLYTSPSPRDRTRSRMPSSA